MKHRLAFISVIVLTLAALIVAEKRKVNAPVSPDPILYSVADTERELGRLPVAVTRLSDQEEIQIGDELARRGIAGFSYNKRRTDPEFDEVQTYLNQVGLRVAAHAHRKLPYRFHYIPSSDFINAFALPGGHVFVGAGIMDLMDSEDELADILGHEIEHIDHYHCAERVQIEARLRHLPLGGLVALPVQLFEVGYSKEQELEADREGTRLAVEASYSPLGAIRMFEAFDRLYREQTAAAHSPQEELTQVALGTLEGYFRSHPQPSERIDQIKRMIADEHWGNLTSERPLEVAYVFWTKRAQRAYSTGRYQEAAALAKRSAESHPGQSLAWQVLGSSNFALANFSQAAAAYRKLLDSAPENDDYIREYSGALAARGEPSTGVRELQEWLAAHFEGPALAVRSVELAGLMLLAHDKAGADRVIAQLKMAYGTELPPNVDGDLGWWNYRAGDYSAALSRLTRAAQQRPGDSRFNTQLGWVLIEQRNYEGALARFGQEAPPPPTYGGNMVPRTRATAGPRMGSAVAFWLARQKDEALSQFSMAVQGRPEWLNPGWTRALYSPTVAKAITEMQAEQKKRRTAARQP
ncbi:MAG: M48 family metalloprotease [Terriglobia bacterium]|jgi:predicted Zn-dependent protease